MSAKNLGVAFEREIREQPAVWAALARSDKADRLARAIDGEVVLLGSGSSLFVAELGALALRRRAVRAHALPATEARLDNRAYQGQTVAAVSQSGRSTDLFDALEALAPKRLIALTNSPDSPLAARADIAIDVGAGRERAVPASKSVSATVALLLHAASLIGGDTSRAGDVLERAAAAVDTWFGTPSHRAVVAAAARIAACRSAAILGSDYGWPVAREMALKLKEASYLHAEGFAAGEFRHGSVAMLDPTCAAIGFVDADALQVVERALRDAAPTGALRFVIGACAADGIEPMGPAVDEPYNTLGWLVAAQTIALHVARARGVDSDAPRGLTKAIVEP